MAGYYDRRALQSVADLNSALEALGVELATKAGVSASRKAANLLRDALREAAPFGPGRDKTWRLKSGELGRANYGHLRNNIRVRRVKAKKQHHIVFNVTTGRAFWGSFLEFGTVNMRARPWFRPTIERLYGDLLDAQMVELSAAVARSARRHGKVLPNGRNA